MYTVKKSSSILTKKLKTKFPSLLITLGSGWNRVLDDAEIIQKISYSELFGVKASVPGHTGELIIARVKGKEVAFMSGRFHIYEGYTGQEVVRPIQVFEKHGLKKVILTAASGALNEKYQVGDFVLVSDFLTLFLGSDAPLKGPKFLDMSQILDQDMRDKARKILVKKNIKFNEGVYVYYHGPNFESPADKMALKFLGADVAGMSTIPEAIMAHWLKLKVISFAFVTNLAFVKHNHKDVIKQANLGGKKMKVLLEQLITKVS